MVGEKKKSGGTKSATVASPRGLRRAEEGMVVKSSSQKTVKVEVTRSVRHAKYGKFIRRSSYFLCHDTKGECGVGDLVEIVEGRPVSAHKRWRVERVIAKAK